MCLALCNRGGDHPFSYRKPCFFTKLSLGCPQEAGSCPAGSLARALLARHESMHAGSTLPGPQAPIRSKTRDHFRTKNMSSIDNVLRYLKG